MSCSFREINKKIISIKKVKDYKEIKTFTEIFYGYVIKLEDNSEIKLQLNKCYFVAKITM